MSGNKNKSPSRPLSPIERKLWERVKKTTTPLENRNALFNSLLAGISDATKIDTASSAKPASQVNFEQKLGLEQKFGPASQKIPRIVKPYSPTPANDPGYSFTSQTPQNQPLDQKTVRKISKGRLGIDGRVDLHGLTQSQAHRRLFQAIENAWMDRSRIILVITGKGLAGEGILRQSVPRWLNEAEFSMMVSGVSEASPAHGGSGALYVRIKQAKRHI